MKASKIINAVCEEFGIEPKELKTVARTLSIVLPRQIVHYFMCHYRIKSKTAIGKSVGGKTHATVINSYAKVKCRMETNIEFAKMIHRLDNDINDINISTEVILLVRLDEAKKEIAELKVTIENMQNDVEIFELNSIITALREEAEKNKKYIEFQRTVIERHKHPYASEYRL